MRVYLEVSYSATDDMTESLAAVRHLTCRVEGLGHKIFMDNFFSSPRLLMTWRDVKRIHKGQHCPAEKNTPPDVGSKKKN
jgi:hypothetical protein